MKVYISSKMSGVENFNFPLFFEVEKKLTNKGHEVVNPARLCLRLLSNQLLGETISDDNYMNYMQFINELNRSVFMTWDIEHLLKCDAICLFGEWWSSRGAILELKVAKECGKTLLEYDVETDTIKPLDEKTLGMKLAEKPRMELVDMSFVEGIARVLSFGASKYGDNSWKNVPDGFNKYLGALLRHITALQQGELYDNETGLPHTAHIGCNAMFLDYFIKLKKEQ